MGLRFFADHCVANSVVVELKNAGHSVMRLRDHLPTDSPDPGVIAMAQSLGAILVSLNGDFADIVSYPPSAYSGIIALRVRNHPELTSQVTQRLLSYISDNADHTHYAGKLLIIEPHQIRIRTG